MSDLNDVVASIAESCMEHLESAAEASDNGDVAAREYHTDRVYEYMESLVRMLRSNSFDI